MKSPTWRSRITFETIGVGCWFTYLDLPKNLKYYSDRNKYEVHYGSKWWGTHKAKKLIRIEEKGFNVKR